MIRRTLIPLWERLEMLFDLDRGLGQLVARLAAERRSSSDLEKIQEHVAAYASPDSDRDVRDQSDRAIHAGIAEATHNPYLVSLQNQIWTELSLGTGNLPGSRRLHEQAVIDHQALSDALAARNGKLAAQINLRHFAELVEIPLRQLRERILEQGAPSESDDALATPEVGTT
jgi:DNA-binding FadR family transcriptional regulator